LHNCERTPVICDIPKLKIKKMKRVWSGEMLADSEETITVLQWNILAQSLGENGDFCLCPEEALQWEHRRQLLLKVRLVTRALNNVCM
jgi:mRNA deadenylase 3'-5' endonuclease subunit Ccr4